MIIVFFQCVQKVVHTLRYSVAVKLQSIQFYGLTVICNKEI